MNFPRARLLLTVTLAIALAGPAAAQVNIGFGGVTHDGSQQVEVTSDTLSVDQGNGQATFSGNVIIVQGDLRMAAGEVRVTYGETDGRQTVEQVLATGGVLVTRGSDAAEGREARYAVDRGILTMSGEILVTQGQTAIAGDSLTVDLATGNGTVEGRVRTTLGQAPDQ